RAVVSLSKSTSPTETYTLSLHDALPIFFQDIQAGVMVSEAELMETSGVGRTPLREALQRLSRDNLVQVVPRRGILVPPISVEAQDRKSTRLNSSHVKISYAVFCLKKKSK